VTSRMPPRRRAGLLVRVVEVVMVCVFVPLTVLASITGDRTVGLIALVVAAAGAVASNVIRWAGRGLLMDR
jgi:hypothetical protein